MSSRNSSPEFDLISVSSDDSFDGENISPNEQDEEMIAVFMSLGVHQNGDENVPEETVNQKAEQVKNVSNIQEDETHLDDAKKEKVRDDESGEKAVTTETQVTNVVQLSNEQFCALINRISEMEKEIKDMKNMVEDLNETIRTQARRNVPIAEPRNINKRGRFFEENFERPFSFYDQASRFQRNLHNSSLPRRENSGSGTTGSTSQNRRCEGSYNNHACSSDYQRHGWDRQKTKLHYNCGNRDGNVSNDINQTYRDHPRETNRLGEVHDREQQRSSNTSGTRQISSSSVNRRMNDNSRYELPFYVAGSHNHASHEVRNICVFCKAPHEHDTCTRILRRDRERWLVNHDICLICLCRNHHGNCTEPRQNCVHCGRNNHHSSICHSPIRH